MRVVHIVLSVTLAGLVLVFSFQNMATVTVSFLTWSATLPAAVLFILVYVLGMVSGGFVMALLRSSLRGGARRHARY